MATQQRAGDAGLEKLPGSSESQNTSDADITSLLTLCNLPSKNEVEKYCRSLNIRQCDFVSFILHAQLGVFVPYKYACAFRDRQPPHLIPTADERAALGASGVGPLQGKATKALYK